MYEYDTAFARSEHRKEVVSIILLVVLFFAIIAGACALTATGYLVDEKNAVKAAEMLGMTEVVVIDRANVLVGMRGCGDQDAARFDVSAKNPKGSPVTFSVCCGWMFKGCTLRSQQY